MSHVGMFVLFAFLALDYIQSHSVSILAQVLADWGFADVPSSLILWIHSTMKTSPLSEHDFLVFHGMTVKPSVPSLQRKPRKPSVPSLQSVICQGSQVDWSDIKAKRAKLAKEAKEANEASEAAEANEEDKEAKEANEAAEAADAAENAKKGICQTKISEYFGRG